MDRGRHLLLWLLIFVAGWANAQSIGDFESVQPTSSDEYLTIPPTHRFQVIVQAGDSLSSGELMPPQADFTGYVPIQGSSTLGRLSVNSEHVPGGVSILEIAFDSLAELWQVQAGARVDLSQLGDSGLAPTVRNCSGGVTPWGTVITCEELESFTDLNGDGYHDHGWSIEIDPVARRAVDHDGDSLPDKLWAMGHFRHENASITADSAVLYEGEDNLAHGFLFKFIPDQPAQLGAGSLYVLRRNGAVGDWVQVPNSTPDERNRTVALADSLGGTWFYRIEDVEVGPDGKVYFASTALGKVFRFQDLGDSIAQFEAFVEPLVYSIPHRHGITSVQFTTPDNLAFDNDGNLWVMQDGYGNHVWVVGPTHTTFSPDLRIFANSPLGSEPTGITFSPDGRFLFMSFQHPRAINSLPNVDASGRTVVFNRDATVVISRAEELGSPTTSELPASEVQAGMVLSPNPTGELLNVHLDWQGTPAADLWVVDLMGRVLRDEPQRLSQGYNRIELDVADLPAGKYILQLRTSEEVRSSSFVKL